MHTRMKHPVHDTDTHFVIDPVTREMTNTACTKSCLIQHDHNSERFTFELPAFIEGHDMLKCDSVQVHYININSQTKEQSAGVYEVTDVATTPDEEREGICFSWLISHGATEYVGSLNFLVRFACHGDDGHLSYVWNTAIYSGISISNGIDNGEAILDDYADILADWKNETLAFRLVELSQSIISTESEGLNVWRATFADGATSELQVRNGAKGEKGDKGDMPDMTGFVKTTDTAQNGGAPGLIKLPEAGVQGLMLRDDGTLSIRGATTAQVGGLAKGDTPIVPEVLAYAVKAGLLGNTEIFQLDGAGAVSNPTSTDKTLTPEEQASLMTWLGVTRVELVSYVGTGKVGESNPCSVTLDFAPKILKMLVVKGTTSQHSMLGYLGTSGEVSIVNDIIICDPLTTEPTPTCGFFAYSSDVSRYAYKSPDGKTVSWYVPFNTADRSYAQCNKAGYTYYLLAIG